MNERVKWWTNCPQCDVGVTIEEVPGSGLATNPDESDESMVCPYDGSRLSGWNGDLA